MHVESAVYLDKSDLEENNEEGIRLGHDDNLTATALDNEERESM